VEPAIVMVRLSVCPSVCVSHTNISETKQDQIGVPDSESADRVATRRTYGAYTYLFRHFGPFLWPDSYCFVPSWAIHCLFYLLLFVKDDEMDKCKSLKLPVQLAM